MDGGYDDGYRACPCFWGDKPGSLIVQVMRNYDFKGKRVLDLGCGEGKNAAAIAGAGANVTALDCSELAIANGRRAFLDLDIAWQVGSASDLSWTASSYDVVVMYGLMHCLPSRGDILKLISCVISATAAGGLHVLVAFNDRSHDLIAHPGFNPTLLPHNDYIASYSAHRILYASDTNLYETHPHNGIPHHHSLTRLIAEIDR